MPKGDGGAGAGAKMAAERASKAARIADETVADRLPAPSAGEYEAVRNAQQNALPKLQGSEKQIAWAESIRTRFIADAEAQVRDFETRMQRPSAARSPENKVVLEIARQIAAEARKVTSAKLIIDNLRNVTAKDVLYSRLERKRQEEWRAKNQPGRK